MEETVAMAEEGSSLSAAAEGEDKECNKSEMEEEEEDDWHSMLIQLCTHPITVQVRRTLRRFYPQYTSVK